MCAQLGLRGGRCAVKSGESFISKHSAKAMSPQEEEREFVKRTALKQFD